MITELEINNFKSIRHIKMDCKRINVLIGKPNVGKSNILEAMALYAAPYGYPKRKFLEDYIRYEKLAQLCYFLDRKNQVVVKSNIGFAALRFHMNGINSYDIILGPDAGILDKMNQTDSGYSLNDKKVFFEELINSIEKKPGWISPYYGEIEEKGNFNSLFSDGSSGYNTPVKKYHFISLPKHHNHFPSFLLPPFGDNLFTIIEGNRELWDEFAGLFNNYGLDLLLDLEEEKLFVQRKQGRYVTKIPYSLVADTLQRYIFHLAAIESNSDSILIFEEPESHSFPPYISRLADKIIENKSNQYFIATHSPYLLTPFIEKCPADEIAIFIAGYENYETKVKALTDKEIENIMETGIDLFFNIRAFQEW